MTHFNYYQTQSNDLIRTFCKISEKCFYNNQNSLVLTENDDYTKILDRNLWTYSKQHFIPHGTNNDTRRSDHPIYITSELENPNKSKIIICINLEKEKILEILSNISLINLNSIEKIIFLYDELQKITFNELNYLLKTSSIKISTTKYFVKTSNQVWQERT